MEFKEIINPGEKLNLILGEYVSKEIGGYTRREIADIVFKTFAEEKKKNIRNPQSFYEVAQGFLDYGMGNRAALYQKIGHYNGGDFFRKNAWENFLFSGNFYDILSLEFYTALEEAFSEKLNKVTIEKLNISEEKVNYFKCFGDTLNPETLLITRQDFRKFTVLPFYKPYIEIIKQFFRSRPTLILGTDLENSDTRDYLGFILSTINKEESKPIYLLNGENKISEEALRFIETFSIILLSDKIDEVINMENFRNPMELKEQPEKTNESMEVSEHVIEEITEEKEKTEETEKTEEIKSEEHCQENSEKISEEYIENPLSSDSELEPLLDRELKTDLLEEKIAEEEILGQTQGCEAEISKIEFPEKKPLLLKEGELPLINIETAPELQFRSLHLYKNPVKYSNIPLQSDEKVLQKFDAHQIKVGDIQLFSTQGKILSSRIGNFVEIKNREFRLKFSVVPGLNKKINSDGKFLEYEIFVNISNGRLDSIADILEKIFKGEPLKIIAEKFTGEFTLLDNLQALKFKILAESQSNYLKISETLGLKDEKKFYTSKISYYENYLLWRMVNSGVLETWANVSLAKSVNIEEVSEIIIERYHQIEMKKGRRTLIEKIVLSDIGSGITSEYQRDFIKRKVKLIIELI